MFKFIWGRKPNLTRTIEDTIIDNFSFLPDSEFTKWDIRFINLADFVSKWSKDPSTKVGAVIVDDRRVVSMGYNGLPQGVEDTEERLNNRDIKYKMIVHAERNAILFAQSPLNGCTLYSYPFMPCASCAGMIVQSGIKRVVSILNDNPRWVEEFELSKKIFKESGVSLLLIDRKELLPDWFKVQKVEDKTAD